MENWSTLKAAIASVIKTNGNQEITGAVLQNTLNSIVNTVGENATFAGIATPTTNPGAPDGPVFYFAIRPDIYTNFNNTKVLKSENFVILYNDAFNNWHKKVYFANNNHIFLVNMLGLLSTLIADYELRRDGQVGKNADEITLSVTTGECYNSYGDILLNENWNRAEITLETGYTHVKIKFSDPASYEAKSFFADSNGNIIEFISSDYSGTGEFIIPKGATKLFISTRNTAVITPTIIYSSNKQPRFANIYDSIIGTPTVKNTRFEVKELINFGSYFSIDKSIYHSSEWCCGKFDISGYTKVVIIFSCSDTQGFARTFFTDENDSLIGKALSSEKTYYYDIPENAKYLYVSNRLYKESALNGAIASYIILYNGDTIPLIPGVLKPIYDKAIKEITQNVEKNTELTADYELRRDGQVESSQQIYVTWNSGYYNSYGDILSNENWNRAEITLKTGYTHVKIKFSDPASYEAKSFFADSNGNIIEFISSDNSGAGNFNTIKIPVNAAKLFLSNRIETNSVIPGTPNPLVYYYNQNVSRFASLEDIELLNKSLFNNKYLHFSLDDFSSAIADLVANASTYNSIFDNSTFALLKQWHDTYGIVVSLYLQRTMSDVPTKFANDFIENKHWLKFGYHGTGTLWSSATYENGKDWWNDFVSGIMVSIGDYEVIDRVPRNDYFHGTLDSCKGERDANCGVLGFLGCDDWGYNAEVRGSNYYLTSEQSTYLDTKDRLYDYENQLCIFKTDFRLEQISKRWSDVKNCLNFYKSASGAAQAYDLIIFSHEWNFTSYKTQAETIFQWAIDNGYRFDFPMNTLLK